MHQHTDTFYTNTRLQHRFTGSWSQYCQVVGLSLPGITTVVRVYS